jgi:drug/metabolite transporter (DMT)-like permease
MNSWNPRTDRYLPLHTKLTDTIPVVTVISTLSGGIAAILGYVFFKERLAKVQVLGGFQCCSGHLCCT